MSGSWSFDGVDDTISAPDSTSLRTPTSALTFAGWVKWVGESTSWTGVVNKVYGAASPYKSYGLDQRGSVEGAPRILVGRASSYNAIDSSVILPNEWLFVAATFISSTELRVRVWDGAGTLQGNDVNTAVGGDIEYSTEPLYFARGENSTRFFQGKLAYWGAHNAVLSDADLDTWRTTGTPPLTLSAFYAPLDTETLTDTHQGNVFTVSGAVYDPNDSPPVAAPPSAADPITYARVWNGSSWDHAYVYGVV